MSASKLIQMLSMRGKKKKVHYKIGILIQNAGIKVYFLSCICEDNIRIILLIPYSKSSDRSRTG